MRDIITFSEKYNFSGGIMTELEKLLHNEWYNTDSEDIRAACVHVKNLFLEYNQLPTSEPEKREAILRKAFGAVGKKPWIESPFQCDIGYTTKLGDYVYMNHNCVFLDAGGITIGNHVLIGPNVGIYTPEHAFDPVLRAQGYEHSEPVTICDNVWIGGSVVILGGVTIGENTIIGAGSVVTHDIPANVIAVGNPCRVLREISEEDKKQHGPFHDKK